MITFTEQDASNIYLEWIKPTPEGMNSNQQLANIINEKVREKTERDAPNPVSTPRIATVTDLGNDTYQLVIQNGTSIMSATLTTPQFIAWELKEANR